ncbi:MAG: hypothetical protein GY836_20505, partial [Herbaspirillum sp.]|uniref:hypothetical protein n=1 Tax=Herbaspirillum sp. TaxID=1890675 RepID=UPI00258E507E
HISSEQKKKRYDELVKNLPQRKKAALEAIEQHPREANNYFDYGNYLFLNEELDEADRYYIETLKLNPEHVAAINNKALISINAREYDTAKRLLGRAKLLGRDKEWDDRIQKLYLSGKIEEADELRLEEINNLSAKEIQHVQHALWASYNMTMLASYQKPQTKEEDKRKYEMFRLILSDL